MKNNNLNCAENYDIDDRDIINCKVKINAVSTANSYFALS